MMWWALWCAAVLVGSSLVVAAPAPDSLNDMVQMDSSVPDDENLYSVQPMMGGRFGAAPWLYLLPDMPHDSQFDKQKVPATTEANEERLQSTEKGISFAEEMANGERSYRQRRSFTVNPPVEHLQRNAFLYYMGRVAQENRDFLNRIGKRVRWNGPDTY